MPRRPMARATVVATSTHPLVGDRAPGHGHAGVDAVAGAWHRADHDAVGAHEDVDAQLFPGEELLNR